MANHFDNILPPTMPRRKGIGKRRNKINGNKNHYVRNDQIPDGIGTTRKAKVAPAQGNIKNKSGDALHEPMELDVKVEIYDDNTVKIRFQSGTATTVVAPSTTTTTDVARRMQPETEDTPTTSTPIIQQAARFQNASLLVDAIKAPPINENAFKYSAKASNNAAPRSKVAERQAKSRALKKYISCVQSLGSEEQQALIMRDASVRPEIRVPSKAAGFNDARASLAIDHQVQQKKMLSRALATPQKQGRAPDDNRSFAESLLVAIAPSPERVRDVQKTSQRAKIESLGLSYTTGRRLLKSAAKKRKRLTEKEEGALWSFVKRRKGHSKVGPELRKELLEWIMNHENVIASPIAKDTLLC
jgi:hypothetical protein